jgi:hypothetical protein
LSALRFFVRGRVIEKGSGQTWETFRSKWWKGWHVERLLHVFLWWQWCGHVGSRRCRLQWGWGHCHWVRLHSLLSQRTVWFLCLFMAVPAPQSMLLLTEDQSHDHGAYQLVRLGLATPSLCISFVSLIKFSRHRITKIRGLFDKLLENSFDFFKMLNLFIFFKHFTKLFSQNSTFLKKIKHRFTFKK